MDPYSKTEGRVEREPRLPVHRRAPGLNLFALAGLAGLLIWAKLRLVTDFPRIVQAEPKAAEPAPEKPADSPPTGSGREPSREGATD